MFMRNLNLYSQMLHIELETFLYKLFIEQVDVINI